MKWLNNKKSNLGIVAAGVLVILRTLFPNLIDDQTFTVLATLIGTWTGISFRVAIKKAQVRN